jgi:CRISPR type I-E-associated protein CasB/Cse2
MGKLLDYVREHKDNRGLMAELRHSLRPTLEDRTWRVLGAFALLQGTWEEKAQILVAKLYALHPKESEEKGTGNFGKTCRALCGEGENPSDLEAPPGPMGRRVQRLLAAEREDLEPMLVRLVAYAKSKEIPVDYTQLEKDLRYWGKETRLRWAEAFWAPAPDDEDEATKAEEEV